MIDTLIELSQNSALRVVALLLAAIIGVGGNVWMYRKKRRDRREKLRRSLHAEINSMSSVILAMENQHDVTTMDPLDPRSFLVDTVYRSSSDDLGLLTKSEIYAVVEFYSTATSIQRVIGDDFHVAYEQVSRRNLHGKMIDALIELRMNGELEPETDLEYEPEMNPNTAEEDQRSRISRPSIPLLRRFE